MVLSIDLKVSYRFLILSKKMNFFKCFKIKGGASLKGNLTDECSFTDITPCPSKKVNHINIVIIIKRNQIFYN